MDKKNQVSYMQVIWNITELLQNSEELDTALADSLRTVVDAIGCEAGSIWFLNKKDNRLYPVFNIGPTDISGMSIANGQGIAGTVVSEGKSVIVADCAKDERFSSSVDEKSGFVTKSMITVPLRNQYETIGCIQIINRMDGTLFGNDELELCENLASLTAIAVEEKGFLVEIDKTKKVILSLKQVTKDYEQGDTVLHVLKGVNLDIYENEFLVVLGESGCGKSTMLNIIGGMDFLTSGEFLFDGRDYSSPTEKKLTKYRRNEVGFIFQSYNLMPNLSAEENLDFIAEICPNPLKSSEALEKVNLSDRADNYPAQMSGGQQQRVSIARAIVKQPKIILADEPTAALDFETGQEVLMTLEDVVKNNGTTVVMITHNVEIAKMANRVIKMKNGVISDIKINMHPLSAKEISW